MNNTITLSQLITRLARTAQVDNNTARRFLSTFFDTVAKQLAKGEAVEIKGIGTFRPVDNTDRAERSIAFIPDAKLAAELNSPFEMFSAVELAPGVEFPEEEKSAEEETTTVSSLEPDTPPRSDDSAEENEAAREMPIDIGWGEQDVIHQSHTPESFPVAENVTPTEPLPETEHTQVSNDHDEIEPALEENEFNPENETEDDYEQPHRNRMWLWIAGGLITAVAIGYIAAVVFTPISSDYDKDAAGRAGIDTVAAAADTAAVAISTEIPDTETTAASTPVPVQAIETSEVKEPVYDEVSKSLIQLARKHYGQHLYWVFIYEANAETIKNPNTIRPGTRVLIPDPSTFPGANTAETKEIAKRKQTEIQNKFK